MNESVNTKERDCDQLLFQSSSTLLLSSPSAPTTLPKTLLLESSSESSKVDTKALNDEDLSNLETLTAENDEKLSLDKILDADTNESRPVGKKWPLRSVSFPLNDKNLVTGYLEPANPWEQAQDLSIKDLILAYKESCDRHHTHPLETVIAQLENLKFTNGRYDELTLKNETLNGDLCEPLEEILKRLQFIKIDLESASLDDESAEALFDMFEYYESAKHVNISSNGNIGERGWQACSQMIQKTQCLEQFDAKDIVLTQQHMNILKRPLQLVTHLQILKLENCGLAGRAFIILISALKVNTGLKELYLADNRLEKPDALQLGALLKANHYLQLLDISNNNIQDVGASDVLDSLVTQSRENQDGQGLSVLILWNNHITKDSSGHFAEVLMISKSLETLNIGQNSMGDEFLEICKESLMRNKALLQLGVQTTGLMQKGILALAEVIETNETLQRIDLRDNNLQLTGLTFMSIALKKNMNITRIDLDDKAWSKSPPLIEQYAELAAEIRSYCIRNEEAYLTDDSAEELSSSEHRSRLSSVSSRKISLTCQTLPRSPLMATASEVTGRTTIMPGSVLKRTSGGRLRSPAPSPIPSPVASPIPSPSRSRFVVSRVSEVSLSSTNSSTSSSPITPPSLSSLPCFFPGDGSRFRVTVVSHPIPLSSTVISPEFKVDVPKVVDSDDCDSVFRLEPENLRINNKSSDHTDMSSDDQIEEIGTNDDKLLAQRPKIINQPDALKHTSNLDRLLGLFHNPGGIFTSAFDTSSARNPFHESVNSMMALGDKFQRYLRETRALEVINHEIKCKNHETKVDEAFSNANCHVSVKKSYVPAVLGEPFVDKDKNEYLMLPRTFNDVQPICDSSTKSSINYSNLHNDTHHCSLTCDLINLLDDDKDINIPIIYKNMSEVTSIDDNKKDNSRSQMNLFIDNSINHRNSQDSGIEESNVSTSEDHFNDSNRPKEHFQGSIDSGIESECSPVCSKVAKNQEDEGCLKELRIALNIPTLDDNKTSVDELIYRSVEGTTKEEIETFLKEKRLPDPKINDSDRIDDILDSEDSSNDENDNNKDKSDDEDDKNERIKDKEVARVQRKKFQTNRAAAKRQMAEDILNTYKKARATTNMDVDMTIENDDHEIRNSTLDTELPLVIVEPSASRSPMIEIQEPNQTYSKEGNLKIGTIKDGLVFLGEGEWRKEKDLEIGTKRHGIIYLGEGVWIKQTAFKAANSAMRPSLFVTTLAYAIWGYEELSNRCVVEIAGKEKRPILEDNKVLALTNAFERYLKKRGCDKITYACEIKNINAYLGRAIGGARKKVKSTNAAHSHINNN